MSKYKKYLRILCILLFVLPLFSENQAVMARRNDKGHQTPSPTLSQEDIDNAIAKKDYQKALQTVPRGLLLDNNDIFQTDSFNDNAATIQSVFGLDKEHKTSVIKVTNGNHQVGGIWSNINKDNYFDINHDQTASMWLYFGPNTANLPEYHPADGMAFVLHNDPNGTNAHSYGLKKGQLSPGDGETLGVWGTDWINDKQISPQDIAKTAIQNSLAIEFDTFSDNLEKYEEISGEGVSFDAGASNKQHIDLDFPALPETYLARSAQRDNSNDRKYFFRMHHKHEKEVNLVDGKWHHLTIKWSRKKDSDPNTPIDPENGYLSYVYNDKNADGTPVPQNKTTFSSDETYLGTPGSIKIPLKNFNLNGNHKLYWGFTGATGKYTENNLIAFESIPSYADASANAEVYDDTMDSTQQLSPQNYAYTNDEIRYKFTLNYNGWDKPWNNIKSQITFPGEKASNIQLTSATISYPNAASDKDPQPIELQNIETDLSDKFSTKKLNFNLPEGLDSDNRKAVIELKGKVKHDVDVNVQSQVPALHATFQGSTLITDTDASAFNIKQRILSIESDTPNPIKVDSGKDVTINGKVIYNIKNPNFNMVTIFQKLDDKQPINLGNIVQKDGTFKFTIKADQLKGLDKLTFYAQDFQNKSNSIDREISVAGLLQFKNISENVSFQPIATYNPNKIIPRSGKWLVEVSDNRKKDSHWTVKAKATNLMSDNNELFNGNIFFRDANGNDHPLTNPTPISHHIKDNDKLQIKNITDEWDTNNGILLSMDKQSNVGKYTGNIFWSLVDAI